VHKISRKWTLTAGGIVYTSDKQPILHESEFKNPARGTRQVITMEVSFKQNLTSILQAPKIISINAMENINILF
jgi:hypothetical protein